MPEPLLSMQHVSKSFPGVHALVDVSLEVFPAEVLAIVGENGAGKSTLMKILTGAIQKDSRHDPAGWAAGIHSIAQRCAGAWH